MTLHYTIAEVEASRAGASQDSWARRIADDWLKLQDEVLDLQAKRGEADRLAYECATAALRGQIRTRTRLCDCLENYLEIGCIDGPKTVPEWVERYEAAKAAREEAES